MAAKRKKDEELMQLGSKHRILGFLVLDLFFLGWGEFFFVFKCSLFQRFVVQRLNTVLLAALLCWCWAYGC